MANSGEPLLRRRDSRYAKEADRHSPKGLQSGRGVVGSSRADVALPAQRRGLSSSGMVRVWNVVSPTVPARIAESGLQGLTGGRVGMGGRSKRRPLGNRADRGSSFAPPRKGADFRLVLNHEKGTERRNPRGYLDDERHKRHRRPAGRGSTLVLDRLGQDKPPRQPTTSPYREGSQGRQMAPRTVSAAPARQLARRQAIGGEADQLQPGQTHSGCRRHRARHPRRSGDKPNS
jgi:hypothetical protein